MSTHLPIYLSPQTIGELPESEREIQSLFIHHWQKIVGPWYSISSEEKPRPVRLASETELVNTNTLFWRILINKLKSHADTLAFTFIKEISDFLNNKVINMPYEHGKEILYHWHRIEKDLV